MSETIEELHIRLDAEEQACANAQRRIDDGGLLGSLVGKYQRWLHRGELQQIAVEIEVAELHQRLQ